MPNKGIELGKGEIVGRIESDDIMRVIHYSADGDGCGVRMRDDRTRSFTESVTI
jgi:hypothetical protein